MVTLQRESSSLMLRMSEIESEGVLEVAFKHYIEFICVCLLDFSNKFRKDDRVPTFVDKIHKIAVFNNIWQLKERRVFLLL